jgi:hypothetical protein
LSPNPIRMKNTFSRLENILEDARTFILSHPRDQFDHKPSPDKWSKKEILGHLIDSAINNLQRFTEIQFNPKPFAIRRYNQNELIKANAYQQADIHELLQLWLSLNRQIIRVMQLQTEQTLNYPLQMSGSPLFDLSETQDKTKSDLRFLMVDYVDHLEHHLEQVMR